MAAAGDGGGLGGNGNGAAGGAGSTGLTAIAWWPETGGGGGTFPTTGPEILAANRRTIARDAAVTRRMNFAADVAERTANAPGTTSMGGSAFGVAGGTGERGQLLRDIMLKPEAALARDESPGSARLTLGASRSSLLGLGLQRTFVSRLSTFTKRLRRRYPGLYTLPITSALRTRAQNTEAGGITFSAHLWGDAIDFAYSADDLDQLWAWDVGDAARRARLQAIVYPGHVHLEISPDGRVGLGRVSAPARF